MAIVVDEYGGTAGLITLEDLLEQVVGDDPRRVRGRGAARPGRGTSASGAWRRRCRSAISNAVTRAVHPGRALSDTVGGWVLDLFGRVPHRGETVEADGIRVTVETMHRNRVLQVLVRLPAAPDARPAAANGTALPDADVGSGSGA